MNLEEAKASAALPFSCPGDRRQPAASAPIEADVGDIIVVVRRSFKTLKIKELWA
jgi:hypothetical protein